MNTVRLILLIALVSVLIACSEIKPSSGDGFSPLDESAISDDEVKGKRYALIIGNANYTGDPDILPLGNPVNDASDMRQVLQKANFEVVYRENVAYRREMMAAVQAFIDKLQPGYVGLFYYAGHAVQVKGENYLIPTQAQLPSETELEYEAMPAQYVLDKMEKVGNEFNIIILDACRDNPFDKKKGKRGFVVKERGGLAAMRHPKGSIIAFATSPDKTAEDGTGRNGIYTKHLLRAINLPGLTLEEMFKQVRKAVQDETNAKQIPWENTSFTGRFCFKGCEFSKSTGEARRQVEKAFMEVEEVKERHQKEELYMPPAN